jgi:predicted secreted protein
MRAGLALVAGLWLAAPALAADGAQSQAIGYSADGKYFAFEQYGIEDGSGFPFWDIFVLDLAADSWVPGTPVRIRIDSEDAKLKDARAKAHAAAKPVIDRLGIDEPANLLLANPQTEILADRSTVNFNAFYRYREPQAQGDYQLAVTTIDLPVPANCTDPDFKPLGLQLTLKDLKTGGTEVLAKDEAIPKSRYCPLFYDIEAVYAPSSYDVPGRHVAIIGYYSRGFEGEDRRFLAVPFDLAK